MNCKEMITNLKKDKKTVVFVIIGLIGIFLLLLSNYSQDTDIDSNSENIPMEIDRITDIDKVERLLEERLTEIISTVRNAGNTKVMVTVASAGEYVYAENREWNNDSDSSSTDTEIVLYEKDDNENGLIICIKSPDVLGVAVICEGGDSSIVKAEITNLVTSLFGIGADRVYVGAKT